MKKILFVILVLFACANIFAQNGVGAAKQHNCSGAGCDSVIVLMVPRGSSQPVGEFEGIILKDGWILTAAHNIRETYALNVDYLILYNFRDGGKVEQKRIEFPAYGRDLFVKPEFTATPKKNNNYTLRHIPHDIGLIKADGVKSSVAKKIKKINSSADVPTAGGYVYHFNASQNREKISYSKKFEHAYSAYLSTAQNTSVMIGDSGSPLFSPEGEIMGVLSGLAAGKLNFTPLDNANISFINATVNSKF
ncbi:hypothetical protein Dip510_000375 [Elusimicrobium posterum]|uniref:trypsin-like peptidase domain-containing protein n=1 Tax=Elusimicrobium posterum TaxID=3116653 RepID=UPI003C714C3D